MNAGRRPWETQTSQALGLRGVWGCLGHECGCSFWRLFCCNGQSVGQPRKRECRQNVRKLSNQCLKNVQKLSRGAANTIFRLFLDSFCLFGRCFHLVTLSNARPLQLFWVPQLSPLCSFRGDLLEKQKKQSRWASVREPYPVHEQRRVDLAASCAVPASTKGHCPQVLFFTIVWDSCQMVFCHRQHFRGF